MTRRGQWWTPARRRGVEILDDHTTPDAVRRAAMRDVARANRWFGGARALRMAVRDALRSAPAGALLLDIGTGTGDLAVMLRTEGAARNIELRIIGSDLSTELLDEHRARFDAAVAADVTALPFRAAAADVVTCSQLLHHFEGAEARQVIAELHRVARGTVVVADLRRSYLAAAGFWLASLLLRFHPVTRHDGVVSVYRGFTGDELREMIRDVTGITPRVRPGAFWRVTATWNAPSH